MLKNVTIRTKLILSFTLVILITALIGYTGIRNIDSIDQNDNILYEQSTHPNEQLVKITNTFGEIRTYVRETILANTSEEQKIYEDRLKKSIEDFYALLTQAKKEVKNTNAIKHIDTIKNTFDAYVQHIEPIRTLALQNKDKEAIELLWDAKSKHVVAQMDQAMQNYITYLQNLGNNLHLSNEQKASNSIRVMSIFLILAILASGVLAMLIAFNIQSILKKLENQIKELVQSITIGKITQRAHVDNFNREFKGIPHAINQMLDAFADMLNAIPIPVMIIDTDYNIQYMNPAGAKLDNKMPAEILGSKCYNHFRNEDCRTERCACTRTFRTQSNVSSETISNAGNKKLNILYSATPIKHDNTDVGALEVVVDQTEIKHTLARIEKISHYQDE
ncbi:MAG: MCP four helix bundle domain-containing protein, partial [Bacteroidales bacterium]